MTEPVKKREVVNQSQNPKMKFLKLKKEVENQNLKTEPEVPKVKKRKEVERKNVI